jgi:hypothetical protein
MKLQKILQDLRRQIIPPEAVYEATKKGHKLLPHVLLPLEGRFKTQSQEIQRRIIDIAWETHSKLQPGV